MAEEGGGVLGRDGGKRLVDGGVQRVLDLPLDDVRVLLGSWSAVGSGSKGGSPTTGRRSSCSRP